MNGMSEVTVEQALLSSCNVSNLATEYSDTGRSRVQTSTQRPAVLTNGFRRFPQSLHENAGILP